MNGSLAKYFCSVGYVSRSGGLSNELNNIISRNTDGVCEGVAIGGDRCINLFHSNLRVLFLAFLSLSSIFTEAF